MINSEKDTDYHLQNEFVTIFKHKYNTGSNKQLFGTLKPDGWFLLTPTTLLIIENKRSISNNHKAQQQIINYAKLAYDNSPTIELIICINAFGTADDFTYIIYEFTRSQKLVKSKLSTLQELEELYSSSTTENIDENQTLQSLHTLIVKETGITSTKELSLFTAFCILACRLPTIRQIISSTLNNSVLFSTLEMEFSKFYDNDSIVLTLFNQPSLKTVNLKPILKITSKLPNTSINELFKQYCKYTKEKQDKNIELTPGYISNLMIELMNEYYPGYESITDPFAGSSSLILQSLPSSHKILIEKESYMYLISKLNLEINNIKNYILIHDDMSNVSDLHADVCITNPPYTKKLSGKDAIAWLCELIGKVHVIMAIIPTTNITDSTYNKYKQQLLDNGYFLRIVINCGKCFKNVNIEASIIILDNYEPKTSYQIFDLTFKYKIDYVKPPLHDMIILPSGLEKIQNILNGVNYIEISDYDSSTDWSGGQNSNFDLSLRKELFTSELIKQIQLYISNPSNENLNTSRFGKIFNAISETMSQDVELNMTNFKEVVISSLFRPVKKIHNYNYKTTNLPPKDGQHSVPMFACKKLDNGIAGYVEHEEYTGDVIVIVKSRNATCGYAFHHSGKLAWSSFNLVIEPIHPMTNEELEQYATYMSQQLAPNHTDKEAFNMSELMNKTLSVPNV